MAGARPSLERQKLSHSGRATVVKEAVEVLSRCVPPSQPAGSDTGLVIGYVQSGKTMSFTTVSALAHDNGFPLVIVITGISTSLLNQSTDRLKLDLGVESSSGRWKHFSSEELRGNRLRSVLTSVNSALTRWSDTNMPPGVARQTVLVTVMKNRVHLDRLIELLRRLKLDGVPTLVIDDEADQAGLNTMVRRNEESPTYRRLLEIRGLLPHHTFLQYTATPQAPLLINLIDALSPSFAVVLTPGESYTGGRTFFDVQKHLISEIPQSHGIEHRKGTHLSTEKGPTGVHHTSCWAVAES